MKIRQADKILLDEELLTLREAWEQTSYELEKLTYNQSYVKKVRIGFETDV